MNRGSSSLKVALYSFGPGDPPTLVLTGKVDRIGQPQASLAVNDPEAGQQTTESRPPATARRPATCSTGSSSGWLGELAAVGHRVVHGGQRYAAARTDLAELLDELRRISPFDPDHLPVEIAMIEAVGRRAPDLPQVACFDTAFHRQMPRRARCCPFPANTTGRASNATAFTVCRMPI